VSKWVRAKLYWPHTIEKQKHSKTILKRWICEPNSLLEAAAHTELEKPVGDISQLDTIEFKRFILKPQVVMPQ
jgi:hypothetical protein